MFVGAEEARQSSDEITVVDEAEVVLHPAVQLARKHPVANPRGPKPVVPSHRSTTEVMVKPLGFF